MTETPETPAAPADAAPLLDDLSNRLFFRLYQCTNMLHKTGTKALDDYGVTTQQWAVLGALSRPGHEAGIAVSELARFLMVSRQNLTGVLSRMEAQGLIERRVSPSDSRSRLIRMTATGQDLWEHELRQRIARFYAESLQGFSTADCIHMTHYLQKLLDNFRALDPEPHL
ncbi:MarR family winged helix-turn-helix transcriptional regulator [Roseospira goensis]|uniref:DNA-binding MarR family transcriptional regulator n=1 Tax=Roseospira goensis TaxID=391922 RepID=A0A7W6WM65_9PROT|nr:MarR family transcriptional regulator [Roseospira goensis]MBB4287443.1 DNA-binding MarR family transcriptional regulator [Roseospira goensis]